MEDMGEGEGREEIWEEMERANLIIWFEVEKKEV